MSAAFAAGTDGRVREGVGNTNLAEIEEWKITKSGTAYGANTFENTADANGVVWEKADKFSMAGAVVTGSGFFNIGDNSETTLYLGKSATLDLFLNKATPFGITDVVVKITKIEYGNKATATSCAPFSFEGKVHGAPPAAG